MKQGITLALTAGLLVVFVYLLQEPGSDSRGIDNTPVASAGPPGGSQEPAAEHQEAVRSVLDISVHTREELKFLLDRAERFVREPRPVGRADHIVLVLHGPEIEFFSRRNYEQYRDLVDQAARLDAFDIVDVKICQTMMRVRGVERDDIPAFIEQVPFGEAEIKRLAGEGYVYF